MPSGKPVTGRKEKGKVLTVVSYGLCFLVMTFILIHALDTFEPTRKVGIQIETFLIDLLPFFFVLMMWLIAYRWPLAGLAGLAGLAVMMIFYYDAYPDLHAWRRMLRFAVFPLPLFIAALLILIRFLINRKSGNHKARTEHLPPSGQP